MIIRITLNDNDFDGTLSAFLDYISKRCPIKFTDDFDTYIQNETRWNQIFNGTLELTEGNKEFVRTNIIEAWRDFGNIRSQYLIKNFEVSFVESVNGEWENGEVYYLFLNAANTDRRWVCL